MVSSLGNWNDLFGGDVFFGHHQLPKVWLDLKLKSFVYMKVCVELSSCVLYGGKVVIIR